MGGSIKSFLSAYFPDGNAGQCIPCHADGTSMCLAFHAKGACYSDCRRTRRYNRQEVKRLRPAVCRKRRHALVVYGRKVPCLRTCYFLVKPKSGTALPRSLQ